MAYYNNQQYYSRSAFRDTTYTKVFVGGLAWETRTDVMQSYFEQFGEILEGVIITDKHTGKSKGYGFVTFGDAESAKRACVNPNPVIDGRRANCNVASLGQPRGRTQGGNHHNEGGASYSGVAATLAHPPPPTASALIYPPYGYAAYQPDYYHQSMYNPQFQQQPQYYQQIYGSSSYYGYSMQQGSRATFSATQLFQGPSNYLYYPATQMAEAATSFRPTTASLTFPSPTESHTLQQSSGETTEVGAVTSESPKT